MPTDYDQLAAGYDQRYRDRSYPGIRQTLLARFAALRQPVLEVGCGTGQWIAALRAEGVPVFGLDASLAMLREARQRAAGYLLHGTASFLPLRAASCAAVYCVHALHHFPDKPAFLREAARLLAPGGTLLIISLDPTRADQRWAVYDYWPETRAHDLARYASTEQLDAWSKSAGLRLRDHFVAEHLQEVRSAEQLLARGDELKRSTSQLADLDAEAYAAGLERLRHAAQEAGESPLLVHADLKICAWQFQRASAG